jgi:hypothetical protein
VLRQALHRVLQVGAVGDGICFRVGREFFGLTVHSSRVGSSGIVGQRG